MWIKQYDSESSSVSFGEVAVVYFLVLGVNCLLQRELFADLIINELEWDLACFLFGFLLLCVFQQWYYAETGDNVLCGANSSSTIAFFPILCKHSQGNSWNSSSAFCTQDMSNLLLFSTTFSSDPCWRLQSAEEEFLVNLLHDVCWTGWWCYCTNTLGFLDLEPCEQQAISLYLAFC